MFTNVIWDTAVKNYESQDNEKNIEKLVRNYNLKEKGILSLFDKQPFLVNGTPPRK